MKLSRIVATGAAFSLVAASVLLGASAANAADYYVDGETFPAEVSPYSAEWFVGGGTTGTLTSQSNGLNMTGKAQILNGDTPATGLQALVDSAGFDVDAGDAFFQVPVFTGPGGTNYTTLRPAVSNSVAAAPTDMWITSGAFGGFLAGGTASLQDFIAAMDSDYEVLAFGAFVDTGDSAVIRSITWNGDTHYFGFKPPAGTVTPSSLTVSALADTGVTFNMTGFVGADTLQCSLFPAVTDQLVNVNPDGTATFTFAGTLPVGDYVISCADSNPDTDRIVGAFFTVTANLPALAATGPADATPFVLGGALLLLIGAGATVFAVRRKQSMSS